MNARPTQALLRPSGPSYLRGLGAGLGLAALITLGKWLAGDTIGPFRLYFLAVLAATWYGGLRVGLVTTLITAAVADLLFLAPIGTLLHKDPVAPLLFCFESVIIAIVTNRLQVERRRTARAASDARGALDKLEAVMRGVDEGITVQDPSGNVIYANEVAARISGYARPEALIAASGPELTARVELHDEQGRSIPATELPGRIVLAGGAGNEKLMRFRLPGTGEERWSLVRANPVRDEDGRVVMAVNIFRDVTEQRRQEEAVRLGREWLSTALSSIADAVVTTEPGGAITFLNPAAAALTGWHGDDARGKPLREVLPLGPQGQLLRRDGSVVVVDESSAPIRATDGMIVGSVHVFRDVSSQRREEARRAYLVEASEELNSSLDVETTLATVARRAVPAFADWCAVDLVDVGQRRRLAVAHVDPAKVAFVAELERRYPSDPDGEGVPAILRTGEPQFIADIPPAVLEAVARDAEHLRLIRQLALRSFIGVPIKRGERILGVISFAMAESNRRYEPADLSLATALADRAAVAIDNALLYRDAQRARQEVAAERDRLAALIMASPTAIAVLRMPELVFELVNEPYRKRMGGLDLVGMAVSELKIGDERMAALEHVLATGEPVSRTAQPIAGLGQHESETRYVSYTVQPLRDMAGTIDRVVLFTADVTDEVQARQRIEVARAQAEQASRAKDEFMAMLGHELRNPLAPIQTALELMRMHAAGQMERERAVIERQVKHLVRLVDDLLDVSRIARGKVELEKEVVELAEVVADAIEIASPLLEERRHVLVTEVPRQGLAVHVDRVRLAQVVSNLVQNAAKYSEPGGRIVISAVAADGAVTLRVRDNGIGISAAMLPRVFDLFVQEPQSIDRSHGGLGLGLTIVKNLVGLHGGRVTAHSEGVGHGSEFVVELPLAGQRISALRAVVSEPTGVPAVLPRVLIVDDNEDAAEMLALVLTARGYPIRVAHDGPSALVAAAELRPEVALVDIGLPVMDGFEVARRLRGLTELAGLRLIAVTGYGQETDRQKSRAAGFDHHLVKPIDVKTVLKIIEAG